VQFLQDNLMMVLIFFTSGLMLVWSIFGNKMRGIKEVDTVTAVQMINRQNAIILDVREQKEFDEGHLLNAKLIPLNKLAERVGELEKYRAKPILVVCRSGQRAATGTSFLSKAGFTQAFNLTGGILAWQKSNLPLEK
jgi:rhodanese-related sulfurtransferase